MVKLYLLQSCISYLNQFMILGQDLGKSQEGPLHATTLGKGTGTQQKQSKTQEKAFEILNSRI